MDTNENETVNYTQFVSSCIHNADFIDNDKLTVVFRMWDYDGNGKISVEDIQKSLEIHYPKLAKTEFGLELLQEIEETNVGEVSHPA